MDDLGPPRLIRRATDGRESIRRMTLVKAREEYKGNTSRNLTSQNSDRKLSKCHLAFHLPNGMKLDSSKGEKREEIIHIYY